jgi:N utilization substance protein A
MELIVPDEKLSLAIGKKGQNVRLASQLTGWRIDIHSESKVREMEARARQSLAAIKVGVDGDGEGTGPAPATVEALFQAGWRSAAEVAAGRPDELATIAGIGNVAAAQTLIAAAAKAAEVERARMAEEAAHAAKEAAALAEKEAEGKSPEAHQG